MLKLDIVTRLGGRMFKANAAFDGHPDALRWNDRITVNTADDLLRFVARYGIVQPQCPHGGLAEAVCILR